MRLSAFAVLLSAVAFAPVDATAPFCGFPEGSSLGANGICAPGVDRRDACERSSFFGILKCEWHVDGYCTSAAVATGEDTNCPTFTTSSVCEKQAFVGVRRCVWYEATEAPITTSVPTTAPPSIKPVSPSMSPVVTTSKTTYCGFPEGAPFEPYSVCAPLAKDRYACMKSSYAGITKCYWSDDGYCTSGAVATNEDPFCPTIMEQAKCDHDSFFGVRKCVWHEPKTEQPSPSPSTTPSAIVSEVPTMTPSESPSAAPTMVNYCGFPFVDDPWASPRQVCSDAATEADCGRDVSRTNVDCYWSKGSCTSDLASNGEDTVCPNAFDRDTCMNLSYALKRSCVWYEPTGPTESPSMIPSTSPSVAPSSVPSHSPTAEPTPSPTKKPTMRPTPSPTRRPTPAPTRQPTTHPTPAPTQRPTPSPTKSPTANPTAAPTEPPTRTPSESPTLDPSDFPSARPSASPTKKPTNEPTAEPSDVPSQQPTSKPSKSPTQSPTEISSLAPSSTPTFIPIEELVRACRCDKSLSCLKGPYEEGSDLFICVLEDPNAVVLESIESLYVQKGGVSQTAVQNGTFIGGTFAVQTGESSGTSSFLIIVNDLETIFEFGTSAELIVEGTVQYSRKAGNLRGSSPPEDENEYTFRVSIPTRNATARDDLDNVVSDGTDLAEKKDDTTDDKSDEVKMISASTIIAFAALGLVAFLIYTNAKACRSMFHPPTTPAEDDTVDDDDAPEEHETQE